MSVGVLAVVDKEPQGGCVKTEFLIIIGLPNFTRSRSYGVIEIRFCRLDKDDIFWCGCCTYRYETGERKRLSNQFDMKVACLEDASL